MRRFVVVLLCSAAASAAFSAQSPLEARAQLLMLADERRFEESALRALAGHPEIGVRESAARVAGSLANPGSVPLLERLGKDPVASVRAAAAEGAGRLGADLGADSKPGKKAGRLLKRLLADDSPAVRRAAAWGVAAGGFENSQAWLLSRLQTEREAVVRAACLAELWRGGGDGWIDVASAALADVSPDVRYAAAWSLARAGGERAVGALVGAAASDDPAVRALVMDGARRSGAGELWQPGLEALRDVDPRVRLAALGALAGILEKRPGRAMPAEAVVTLLGDRDPERVHERVMAIRLAGFAAIGEPELRSCLGSEEGWVAEEALVALARQRWDGAREAADEWLASPEVSRRAAAVEALALLPDPIEPLTRACADPAPAVRLALIDAATTTDGEATTELLRGRLTDGDEMVRAAALAALAERAALPDRPTLFALLGRERGVDARVALVEALAAGKELGERETTAMLRLLWGDDPVVARAAWVALRSHGQLRPLPLVNTGMDAAAYTSVLEWAARERYLEVVTVRGTMVVALDVAHAPLAAYRLSRLAEENFFDGLTFHRVVPNFVAQGGDPRGDGWGGPPFTLRHELSLVPFDPGVVGLAHSGPDTAGSQLFFTLTPQPHLTGRYPVAGRVVAGLDVAGRLRRGDRILRIRASETAPHYFPVWYGAIDPARLDAGIDGWRDGREGYAPRADLIDLLARARLRYALVVAMGTWCGDSREQVPRLQSILANLGDRSPFAAPVLIGGDRGKGYPAALFPFGPVELVPTIVVTLEGAEIGRVVEKPSSGSLEEDLATILAPFEGWDVPEAPPEE